MKRVTPSRRLTRLSDAQRCGGNSTLAGAPLKVWNAGRGRSEGSSSAGGLPASFAFQ